MLVSVCAGECVCAGVGTHVDPYHLVTVLVQAESMQQLYEQVAMDTISEAAVKLEELVFKSSFNQVHTIAQPALSSVSCSLTAPSQSGHN